ncbi:MAG: N-acetylglucosamine-6-sulfatase [Thermoleophilaceae bacterium]|nr:N-acetylglucosamine-6-sulfatase [Thermoleophilaceae bacterium]
MRRLSLTAVVVFACALLGAGCGHAPGIAPGGAQPNVLVILTDDQDIGQMQFLPNVQRLVADQGTTFTNSIVSNPLCCPSRATLLTGQYSQNNGVLSNHGGFQNLDLQHTLGVWMKDAGYHTAYIGKFLNGYPGKGKQPLAPPGWDEFVTPTRHVTDMYHYKLAKNGHERPFGTSHKKYKTTILGRLALKEEGRALDQPNPFMLIFAPTAPHAELSVSDCPDPRIPPGTGPYMKDLRAPRMRSWEESNVSDKPRYIRKFPKFDAYQKSIIDCQYRGRALSLVGVDYWVDRLIDRLDQAGQLDNTLIMFASDNGYLEGQHRVPTGKVLPYEESIRVPLIFRGPTIPAGVLRSQLVANIDWAPTILDAAGVKPNISQDGISLLPLMQNPLAGRGRDILIQASDYVPFPGNHSPAYEGIRSQRWTYVEYHSGERELYDLKKDPDQLRNLDTSSHHGATRKRLAAELDKLRVCKGASCGLGLLPTPGAP